MIYFLKIIIEGNCKLMTTLTKSDRSTTNSLYRNTTALILSSLFLLSCGGGGSGGGGGLDIAEETAKAIAECGPNLEYTKGSIPIILTNPHGASDQDPSTLIPDVSLRTGRNFNGLNGRFVTIPDTNTDIATDILADRIESITGERPYVIKARFRRSQIDAARSAPNVVNQPINSPTLVNLAYDDPKAKPCYDAFYYAINESITEIRENYGRGFIFDIHSTRRISVNTGVARGTLSVAPLRGESIKELIRLFGNSVLDGPDSLFGIIGSKGIITTPMDQRGDDEACCVGSYVVQRWGGYVNPNYPTRPNNTMDTIMIEIAKTITEAPDLSTLTNTMNIVGESIVEYYDIWYND